MLFQYIGDAETPQVTTVFGHDFELFGAAVEITDAKIIAKLKGNASFAEVASQDDIKKAPEPVVEVIEAPKVLKTFDLPPLKEDLSDLTEDELAKLTVTKKKGAK